MKKFLIFLLMMIALPLSLWSQTYKELWKKVNDAEMKDLPRTQLKWLGKIKTKAEREKSYGNLLAAEMMSASLWTQISPDSAAGQKAYLEKRAREAEKKDAAMGAVYYCALGKLLEYDREDAQFDYYKKALANPEVLAKHKLTEYNPLIESGRSDNIFANDLLHVIGMEVENYELLNRFYAAQGNREAACYTALMMVQGKKNELARLDSIINLYGDLPICGEVAVRKYNVIKDEKPAGELVEFIDKSIDRWKSWGGIKELQNARRELTSERLEVQSTGAQVIAGSNDAKCMLRLRNLTNVTLTITRTALEGATKLNPEYKKDLEKIQKELQSGTRRVIRRDYPRHEDYEFFRDSIQLPPLDAGVYLLKFESSAKGMTPEYRLFYSSRLFLMAEEQPGAKIRYVVVDAASGQPVPGAKVRLIFDEMYNRKAFSKTLTTGKNGEAMFSFEKEKPRRVFAYTDNDKGCLATGLYNRYSCSSYNVQQQVTSVFTDRKIYRPGQTVHVGVVVFDYSNREQKTRAEADQNFEIDLLNANYEIIATNEVTTDRFGTASTSFELPTGGLTGTYSVVVRLGTSSSASFNVEEYKRPTFEVNFDEYKEAYAVGDTIKLKGRAKSFAGVPVPNAKVHYTVTRRQAWWWWRMREADKDVFEADVRTDAQGEFTATLPFVIPEDDGTDARFFNFEVNADVTDQAGESRQGYASLPLGTKPTAFSTDMKEKNLKDELKSVTFNYRNAAGKQIDGQVRFAIVPQADHKAKKPYKNFITAEANKPVQLKPLASGSYHLHAICGKDTLDTDFYVFSLTDRRPVIETHDWFYASANRFPRDGKPVYIQMGSTDADQHVVYSIYSGNKIIETGAFDQSNAITTRTFTYKEEYGDGITINVAWVKNGRFYPHTVSIARPMPDKRLALKWKTFRNKLTPGQTEEWTLTVQRPDGKAADAQLMATLYDKSLDQIIAHSWSLSPSFYDNLPQTMWSRLAKQSLSAISYVDYPYIQVPNLSFASFNYRFLEGFSPDIAFAYGGAGNRRYAGKRMMALSSAPMKEVAYDSAEVYETVEAYDEVSKNETRANVKFTAPVVKKDEVVKPEKKKNIQLRENLNETAFFYPQLQADAQGNISVKFTLPESLTTWRFMGVAHDQDINSAYIEAEAVAQKTVMVQPNIPRFLRRGDEAAIATRLINTSDAPVKGICTMQLIDPETDKVIFTDSKSVTIPAAGTIAESFWINNLISNNSHTLSAEQSLLIARIIIEGDNYSDGEQRYLPILPSMERVTNTRPFTQNTPGTETIDLGKLFPKKSTDRRLTVEYTNNPAWLMIQALPYVAAYHSNNAISLSAAYYANKLADKIIKTSPKIHRTIQQWKQEKGTETSMMSALRKNQELKELALEETPWVTDANNEAKQKQNLIRFFDENALRNQLSTTLTELKRLQGNHGGFSWYCDMKPNFYMTIAVTKTLARLNHLTAEPNPETTGIINSAFRYLDREVAKQVAEMKKDEKKYKYTALPSDELCNYVYVNALAKRPTTADITYLVDRIAKKPAELTIYGKALTAVILMQYGKADKASQYLQSIKEYTVYKEEMGRYFDSRNAYYSWRDYRIPTQVAAIEALKLITPTDQQTIQEMQRWLLQEKRTQAWDTPVNSVDAIWAFMNNGLWNMDNGEPSVLKIDSQPLATTKATAGLGYVKATQSIDPQAAPRTFTVEKTSTGTSWGAVYAQFFQPVTEVAEASSGLKVKREILADSTRNAPNRLKVGEKIIIRLTITADRDYDFVQLIDKRAACLEPINQLSGYHWGYYIAPKDYTTNYYFDRMAKGRHIIETEYFVDREGVYQTGVCTVQCAYSPEYSGRTPAVRITVDENR